MDTDQHDADEGTAYNPYEHLPLPSTTSIRLIKLYDMEGPLSINIETVDLAKKPRYCALSYTWGNPRTLYQATEQIPDGSGQERSVRVTCNGNNHLFITQNLFDFLVQWQMIQLAVLLMEEDEGGLDDDLDGNHPVPPLPKYLWVDAICIDQENISERSAQVAMMDQIYGACKCCIVWLGNSDWLTKRAVRLVEHISSLPIERGLELKNFPITETRWRELLQMSEEDCVALWALFNRSWFYRAWIIQEMVLSPWSLWVCPETMFDFGIFSSAARFLAETGLGQQVADYVFRRLKKGAITRQQPGQVSNLISTISERTQTGLGYSLHILMDIYLILGPDKMSHHGTLLELLYMLRFTTATDPRDKIYAFLSLAKRFCSTLR